MFRKFSISSKKRSSESAVQTPPVAAQPSRSSAPIPTYSPRFSAQTTGSSIQAARMSDQAPVSYSQSQRSRLSEQARGHFITQSLRSSDQRPCISGPITDYHTQSPGCYAHSPQSSDQRPRNSDQTSGYFTQSPHSSVQGPRISDQAPRYYTNSPRSSCQTPRSSASAPYTYSPHPLSPPPPNIPYDTAAWAVHDIRLSSLLTKATNLDNLASTAELRWKAAEALLPPSRQHEVGVFAKIPVLRDVHVVLRQVRKLGRTEKKWRMQWMPRSPRLKYSAWGSCYAEAVEVYEGEGVSPEFAVGMLYERLKALTGVVRGWIEEDIWGREWWDDGEVESKSGS
ncbi:hypothetical protein PtrSN002B_005935 [Pyrenophora tritici-repentis]|uniref:Atrophin-1 multi-domain protein n=2 Tax=Pyrenophora tritici-repentis TaxID=45151 RepID=A0A2W1H6N7_9PLEO|nr:uncharacterized protein PTRG_05153 [Pyrenophora tritici-repentis Pt-1C-BFP]KAA8611684.1 Herpes-BLLF1 domain-containing protein [Pyrenophora tritici-repentis]EDU48060.1 predicted protein [Pyrenophora tritici-repentis Pt-1C-BFP]KAF7447416.1 Herpes BLLF1 domain containing protein [Pyrenophora tritici-repentis]KAF7569782.1 Atrophin-1 multi-domain protein [Pyrenophora tritici-repentis]KAG9382495.1 Herpes BLLF1 domain containing protein [Pyrenophora tritici-repentis]